MKIIITTRNLTTNLFNLKSSYTIKSEKLKRKLRLKESYILGDKIYIFESIIEGKQAYSKDIQEFIKLLEGEISRQRNEKWLMILHARDVNLEPLFKYKKLLNTEIILFHHGSLGINALFNQRVSKPSEAEQIIKSFFLFFGVIRDQLTLRTDALRDKEGSENAIFLAKELKEFVFSNTKDRDPYLYELLRNALEREECEDAEILCDTIFDLTEINLFKFRS